MALITDHPGRSVAHVEAMPDAARHHPERLDGGSCPDRRSGDAMAPAGMDRQLEPGFVQAVGRPS